MHTLLLIGLYGELVCTQALKSSILYLILAPYDNEQSDLIHRLKEDKSVDDLPTYK